MSEQATVQATVEDWFSLMDFEVTCHCHYCTKNTRIYAPSAEQVLDQVEQMGWKAIWEDGELSMYCSDCVVAAAAEARGDVMEEYDGPSRMCTKCGAHHLNRGIFCRRCSERQEN